MQHLSLKFANLPVDGEEPDLFSDEGFKIEQVAERRAETSVDAVNDNIKVKIQKALGIIMAPANANTQWKNSPLIWELLSLREEEILGKDTNLPQLINEAVAEMPGIEALDDVQRATLIEEIDDVVHQTHLRRKVILSALALTIDKDLSGLSALDSSGLIRNLTSALAKKRLEACDVEGEVKNCHRLATADKSDIKEITVRAVKPGFDLDLKDTESATLEDSLNSQVGDIYLARSPKVGTLGDHFILMIGGMVRRAHGMRPDSIAFGPIPTEESPLNGFDNEGKLVLFKLNDVATQAFYNHYQIEDKFRRK